MTSALRLRTAAVAAVAAICLIPLLPAAAVTGYGHRHVDSVKGSAELEPGQNRATIDASGSPDSARGYIRFKSRSSLGTFRVKVNCLWVHELASGSTEAWVSGRIAKSRGMEVERSHALFLVHTFQDPRSPWDGEQSGYFILGSSRFDCTAFEREYTDAWKNGSFLVKDNDPTN
jgi:hypothetical protein